MLHHSSDDGNNGDGDDGGDGDNDDCDGVGDGDGDDADVLVDDDDDDDDNIRKKRYWTLAVFRIAVGRNSFFPPPFLFPTPISSFVPKSTLSPVSRTTPSRVPAATLGIHTPMDQRIHRLAIRVYCIWVR